MTEADTSPSSSIMAAAALARIVLLWGSMAQLAIRVVGMVERHHHPAADLVAVGASTLIVIIRRILGVAISAFAVEVMSIISLAPVLTCVVTPAAILTVVIFRCRIQVTFHTLLDRVVFMFGLGIRPGVRVMTFGTRARRVLAR